ncbi:MAG: hypothetical protein ABIJ05_01160 [Patescibacteria group bacterium]
MEKFKKTDLELSDKQLIEYSQQLITSIQEKLRTHKSFKEKLTEKYLKEPELFTTTLKLIPLKGISFQSNDHKHNFNVMVGKTNLSIAFRLERSKSNNQEESRYFTEDTIFIGLEFSELPSKPDRIVSKAQIDFFTEDKSGNFLHSKNDADAYTNARLFIDQL